MPEERCSVCGGRIAEGEPVMRFSAVRCPAAADFVAEPELLKEPIMVEDAVAHRGSCAERVVVHRHDPPLLREGCWLCFPV